MNLRHRFHWTAATALPFLFLDLAPAQEAPRSPRNANYEIQVRLDPDAKTLEATQLVRWRNIHGHPTDELWFHLYYNAWRNSRSTWLTEARLRRFRTLSEVRKEDWGYCDVLAVGLRDRETGKLLDLTPNVRFESPDDGNPEDRTVLVVALPYDVGPEETVELQMSWRSKIPRTFARTGYRGDFFFLAHWFPSLGVYQADGAWNCHQFHANTEFFSDYGVYDVRMTVPAGWPVGATGIEVDRVDHSDGTSTHRYRQEDVHTFTWTTSPDYREARDRFQYPGLKAVEIRLLYQPEHEGQVDRHFRATRAALQYYGTWFGEYPYEQVTVIDPAWRAGAGGMEYPTLFTCGTRYLNPEGGGSPEGVTVHEAGHQFWYGVVGNNEFEHAWLDEGLNTFSTARTMATAFGESFWVERFFRGFIPVPIRSIRKDRWIFGHRLDSYRASARGDRHSTPSYLYHPGNSSAMSYSKTALFLGTLEKTLGWEVLRAILSSFFERWKFRHPTPEDFFVVADEVAGTDLSYFFDQVHRSSAIFDYAVSSASSRREETRGWIQEEGELRYPASEEETGASSESDDNGQIYETEVVVRRLGDGILPVEVLLKFEDGSEYWDTWDPKGEWKRYRLKRPVRLAYAVIDPDRKLLLDINYTNNSLVVEPKSTLAATKWGSKWMLWVQDYLQTLSFLM